MTKSKHSLSWSSSPESKQQKFDETLYAWKVQEEIAPITLSLNLECTQTMVQNYTTDLKYADMRTMPKKSESNTIKQKDLNVRVRLTLPRSEECMRSEDEKV